MSVPELLDSVQGEKRSLQDIGATSVLRARRRCWSRADDMAQKMVNERMAKEIRGLKEE